MKKLTKTFYVVCYGILGADRPGTAFFDDRREALDFQARTLHADRPSTHVLRNPDAIAAYESMVEATRELFRIDPPHDIREDVDDLAELDKLFEGGDEHVHA